MFWKGFYNVKFNMNAQTWLLNHYWLFLLEYFFPSQGGPWAKRLCRLYAYDESWYFNIKMNFAKIYAILIELIRRYYTITILMVETS